MPYSVEQKDEVQEKDEAIPVLKTEPPRPLSAVPHKELPMAKFFWYIKRVLNLVVVCLRLLLYCITHPKKIYHLCFSIFSTINEFYQTTHGQLLNFEDTKIFKEISKNTIFSKNNVFNMDSKVTRPMETQVLSALVCFLQPRSIFEIGTYNGFTTLHFAINSLGDCSIFTLDLPPDFNVMAKEEISKYSYDDLLVVQLSMENIKNRVYQNHPQKTKIRELFGDSKTFDYSPYHKKIDFIFIDGNHSSEFVKSDTDNAFKMLSERGVIVWHDYDYIIHRDVFKYLNKLSREHKIYSIPNTRFAIYGRRLE